MKMPETDDLSAQTPASCINRSDIIRMAREARMPYFYGTWQIANVDGLERFANLVAAHKPVAWVGLTDEEIKEIIGPWGNTPIKGYTRKLFDQIEAKLKEKNT